MTTVDARYRPPVFPAALRDKPAVPPRTRQKLELFPGLRGSCMDGSEGEGRWADFLGIGKNPARELADKECNEPTANKK